MTHPLVIAAIVTSLFLLLVALPYVVRAVRAWRKRREVSTLVYDPMAGRFVPTSRKIK